VNDHPRRRFVERWAPIELIHHELESIIYGGGCSSNIGHPLKSIIHVGGSSNVDGTHWKSISSTSAVRPALALGMHPSGIYHPTAQNHDVFIFEMISNLKWREYINWSVRVKSILPIMYMHGT